MYYEKCFSWEVGERVSLFKNSRSKKFMCVCVSEVIERMFQWQKDKWKMFYSEVSLNIKLFYWNVYHLVVDNLILFI